MLDHCYLQCDKAHPLCSPGCCRDVSLCCDVIMIMMLMMMTTPITTGSFCTMTDDTLSNRQCLTHNRPLSFLIFPQVQLWRLMQRLHLCRTWCTHTCVYRDVPSTRISSYSSRLNSEKLELCFWARVHFIPELLSSDHADLISSIQFLAVYAIPILQHAFRICQPNRRYDEWDNRLSAYFVLLKCSLA